MSVLKLSWELEGITNSGGFNIIKFQLILEKCILVRREECSKVATKTRRVEVPNWYQIPQLGLISVFEEGMCGKKRRTMIGGVYKLIIQVFIQRLTTRR